MNQKYTFLTTKNEKVWSVKEKETLYRQSWKDHFRISEQKKINLNQDHERQVEGLIVKQRELTKPSLTADSHHQTFENYCLWGIFSRRIYFCFGHF